MEFMDVNIVKCFFFIIISFKLGLDICILYIAKLGMELDVRRVLLRFPLYCSNFYLCSLTLPDSLVILSCILGDNLCKF